MCAVVATVLAGFAVCAVFADEMLPREGTMHAFVALLQQWSVWPGPPDHVWNRWAPFLLENPVFTSQPLPVPCCRRVVLPLNIRASAQVHAVSACCSAAGARHEDAMRCSSCAFKPPGSQHTPFIRQHSTPKRHPNHEHRALFSRARRCLFARNGCPRSLFPRPTPSPSCSRCANDW